MRNGLLLTSLAILALLMAAACSGNTSISGAAAPADSQADAAQQGIGDLADLPSPREVSVGESVLEVETGTRSFIVSTAQYLPMNGAGVSQDTSDFHLVFEPTSPSQISHIFFPIFSHFADQRVTMGQVSLEMEWYGETPTGQDGYYVGVPDYENDKWIWRGPAQSPSDIMDFSDLALSGNPDEFAFDNVLLVNFSDVETKLFKFNFTVVHPDDNTGDEMLFYITDNSGSYSVHSSTAANLDSPSMMMQDSIGVELANLRLLELEGGPQLVFDRRESGGNWEVWQSDLDGSNAQVRYSGAEDVRFAVVAPETGYEYTLEGSGPDYYSTLTRHEPGVQAYNQMLEIPGMLAGEAYWYGSSLADDVAIVGNGMNESSDPAIMVYTYSSFNEMGYFNPMVYLDEGATADDAFYFRWDDGTIFGPRITLYTRFAEGSSQGEIRASFLGQPAANNNKTFISHESYSLRYPSVSPDNRLLSVVACEPGEDSGMLFVQSSFLRELDETAAVAANVSGRAVWYDPTPPQFEQ